MSIEYRQSNETTQESEQPQSAKPLWSPRAILIMSILFSVLIGGIMAGMNYGRLGKPRKKALTILGVVVALMITWLIAIAIDAYGHGIHIIGLMAYGYAIRIGIAFELMRRQREDFRRHIAMGGEKASLRVPVIWGVLLLFVSFGLDSLVGAFKIPSAAMEDTLLIGDRILVAKFAYGVKVPFTRLRILDFHKPEVGDVLVFKSPRLGRSQKLVKRVAGIPGDVIEIRSGDLYRNGKQVEGEDYVKRHPTQRFSPTILQNFGPVSVPPGHFFALGDNRDRSSDSRVWGTVPYENITGQVFLIYWSWNDTADWRHKLRFSRIGRRVK